MLKQTSIAITVLAVSWWAMTACHELGHILGAYATGGAVQHVELRPWHFSRTDVDPNPLPGIVVWSGPIVGIALPLLVWLLRRKMKLTRFFAGFCLIANGCYIGAGWAICAGDTYVMHLTGTPNWLMAAFGVICLALGLCLWHGLGPRLGLHLGSASQPGVS